MVDEDDKVSIVGPIDFVDSPSLAIGRRITNEPIAGAPDHSCGLGDSV